MMHGSAFGRIRVELEVIQPHPWCDLLEKEFVSLAERHLCLLVNEKQCYQDAMLVVKHLGVCKGREIRPFQEPDVSFFFLSCQCEIT